MSFFRTVYKCNCKQCNNHRIQKYLRARANLLYLKFKNISKSNCFGKRMSPSPFCFRHGSMTVEAALAVPLFLFFLMNILYSFEMIRLQSNLTAALHQTGNRIAFNSYTAPFAESGTKTEGGEGTTDRESAEAAGGLIMSGISAIVVKGEITDRLGADYLDHTCLLGGSAGLYLGNSSVGHREKDIIELVASFRTSPFIKVMGFHAFAMESRYYARAWTGYDVTGGQEDGDPTDPIVFVAQTGTVYHRERDCAYLNPSVEVVSAAAVTDLRNETGGKYYACERCGSDSISAVMFLTSQGNRYHGRLDCPSLKRTVYTVRLSETGGKGECGKCGRER